MSEITVAAVMKADDGTELLRIGKTEDGRPCLSSRGGPWTDGASLSAAEVCRLLADD
jgi:hypothetical protein